MSSLAARIASMRNREAVDWANAVRANGGTVSAARLALVSTYIGALKACGAWGQMDDAALLVAENAGQALTSLKGRRLMTAVAAPTFAADAGYAFNGTTQYINTGFIAETMAQRMSFGNVRVSIYERTNVASTATGIGATRTSGSQAAMQIRPRIATDAITIIMMSSSSSALTGITDSRGLTAISRAGGGTTVKASKNGAALSDITGLTVNNTQLPDVAFYIGCNNLQGVAATFRANTVGYADWGAPLSTAQELAAYNALQAFMTAVGAQV